MVPSARRSESRLFLVILALSAFHVLFLAIDRRIPPDGSAFAPGGLLQAALPWGGPFLRGMSLVGMLLEELLLLVGLWRLSSRYFHSPAARFFVSAAGAGSSLWVDPGAPTLRLFAALPLLLSLSHDLLESASRRPLLLGGALLVLHAMGKSLAVTLAVPAAVALYVAVVHRGALERLKSWGAAEKITVAAAVGLAAAVAWFTGPGGFAGSGPGRPFQIVDLLFGLSLSTGMASYCGILTAAFAVLALSQVESARPVGIVLVALTAIGLLVPVLFPLLRLFLIVLSGFGFQAAVDRRFGTGRSVRVVAAGLALAAVVLGAATELLIVDSEANLRFSRALSLLLEPSPTVTDVVGFSAMTAALAAGILVLWSSGPRGAPLALGLALFLHSLDVFGWKFRMAWLNTIRLVPEAGLPSPSMAWPWGAALGLLSLFWIVWTVRETARIARGAPA